MQVVDEVDNKLKNARLCRRVVVGHLPGQIIIGYVNKNAKTEASILRVE